MAIEDHHLEEERIRSAYELRRKNGLYSNAGRYSFFDPGHVFMVQEQEREILALLRRYHRESLEHQRILEIGCGTGYWLREFIRWGARPENLVGIDLLPDRIEEAKALTSPGTQFICGNATALNLPAASFDIVFQSTVFTSILDPAMRTALARKMVSLLKTGGIIIWYDSRVRNPRNSDVRAIKRNEILGLFPDCTVDLRSVNLAPPLARNLAPYSWLLCCFLSRFKLLSTHYLGGIRKNHT